MTDVGDKCIKYVCISKLKTNTWCILLLWTLKAFTKEDILLCIALSYGMGILQHFRDKIWLRIHERLFIFLIMIALILLYV